MVRCDARQWVYGNGSMCGGNRHSAKSQWLYRCNSAKMPLYPYFDTVTSRERPLSGGCSRFTIPLPPVPLLRGAVDTPDHQRNQQQVLTGDVTFVMVLCQNASVHGACEASTFHLALVAHLQQGVQRSAESDPPDIPSMDVSH